jgi:hypothetical protein
MRFNVAVCQEREALSALERLRAKHATHLLRAF